MIDQRAVWNRKHGANQHSAFRDTPMSFATEVISFFPEHARVLDLGCGVGGDAYFFAQNGHSVLATDFSATVIAQNKKLLQHPNLQFKVADTVQAVDSLKERFDIVYAHLSLHYFDDATTKKIFADVTKLLKPGGLLCFACKSPNDPYYGAGRKIEPNFFISNKGHLRHFFTPDYVMELLANNFNIEKLEEVDETYINRRSAFVRCIARKP